MSTLDEITKQKQRVSEALALQQRHESQPGFGIGILLQRCANAGP
jgi:hypothetical protein